MKKLFVMTLAVFLFFPEVQLFGAESTRKQPSRKRPCPSATVLFLQALNCLDGIPCGASVQVADIEDGALSCKGCRHKRPIPLPEMEVSCGDVKELRAFSRTEWKKKDAKATRLVLVGDLADVEVSKDKDGYSVTINTLTINLPQHVVEVIIR